MSISPSNPLFTNKATISFDDNASIPLSVALATPPEGLSGFGGVIPLRLALTMPALAMPRMGFSGMAFTKSILFSMPILIA